MNGQESTLKAIIILGTPICLLGGFLPYLFLYLDSSHVNHAISDYLIMVGLSFFIWFWGLFGLKVMKNEWCWFQKKK